MNSDPVWRRQLETVDIGALEPSGPDIADERPDVLVVGGGMVGLAAATFAVRSSLGKTLVLDAGSLGRGATGGAAGLLVPDAHWGSEPDSFVALGRTSMRLWRQLDEEWPGGLGVVPVDWISLDPQPSPFAAALPPGSRRLTPTEVAECVPGLAEPMGGVLIPDQARLNPLRAAAALARYLPVVINAAVSEVRIRNSRIISVTSRIGTISPGQVIFATGGPPNVPGLRVDLVSRPVKGHLLTTTPAPLRLSASVFPLATQLDDGRLLAGGTLDVDDDSPNPDPQVIARIHADLVRLLPSTGGLGISNGWCCFRPALADLLPVIDRVPGVDNAWMTCGHYRTGILMAPATGQALTNWISANIRPSAVTPLAADRPTLR